MSLVAAALTLFDGAKLARPASIFTVFHASHVLRRDLAQTRALSVLIRVLSALAQRCRHRVELPQARAHRVAECNGPVSYIGVEVNPAFEPNGVLACKTPDPRIVIASAVVVDASLRIEFSPCASTPHFPRHILCLAPRLQLLQRPDHLRLRMFALRHASFPFLRPKSYSDLFGFRGARQRHRLFLATMPELRFEIAVSFALYRAGSYRQFGNMSIRCG